MSSSSEAADNKKLESLRDRLDKELKLFDSLQKQLISLNEGRRKYYEQAGENDMVKAELDAVPDGTSVFKLVGPVLVKQDKAEAVAAVASRLQFIKKELSKAEATEKELDGKLRKQNEAVQKVQSQLQEILQKQAAQSQAAQG